MTRDKSAVTQGNVKAVPSGISATATTERSHKRPLLASSHATRCKTFHCKLSDASLAHLNEQLNEWTDLHEDVEIKFAVNTVGVIADKSGDPHLILTIFY